MQFIRKNGRIIPIKGGSPSGKKASGKKALPKKGSGIKKPKSFYQSNKGAIWGTAMAGPVGTVIGHYAFDKK